MDTCNKKNETFEHNHFPFKAGIQRNRHELAYLHWHEHLEFIKVLEGQVRISIGNKNIDAKKGNIIFINSCIAHSVHSLLDTNAAIMAIVFDKFFITNIIEGFKTKHIYSLFTHADLSPVIFSEDHPVWNELDCCIKGCYCEYVKQDICCEMSIKSFIYRAITTLIRYYAKENPKSQDTFKLTNKLILLKPIFDYIDKNYDKKIYVEKLSRSVNMSTSHFSRFFKNVTGKSPVEYINHIRLNMAMKLLMDSPMSVTEISEKTGFCNINYFDAVFKKKIGVTPAEFRHRSNQPL